MEKAELQWEIASDQWGGAAAWDSQRGSVIRADDGETVRAVKATTGSIIWEKQRAFRLQSEFGISWRSKTIALTDRRQVSTESMEAGTRVCELIQGCQVSAESMEAGTRVCELIQARTVFHVVVLEDDNSVIVTTDGENAVVKMVLDTGEVHWAAKQDFGLPFSGQDYIGCAESLAVSVPHNIVVLATNHTGIGAWSFNSGEMIWWDSNEAFAEYGGSTFRCVPQSGGLLAASNATKLMVWDLTSHAVKVRLDDATYMWYCSPSSAGSPDAVKVRLDDATCMWSVDVGGHVTDLCEAGRPNVLLIASSTLHVSAWSMEGAKLWDFSVMDTAIAGEGSICFCVDQEADVVVLGLHTGSIGVLSLVDREWVMPPRGMHGPSCVQKIIIKAGIVFSVSNHLRAFGLHTYLSHGVFAECELEQYQLADFRQASMIAWGKYALEASMMILSIGQLLSFVAMVPSPPHATKPFFTSIKVLQDVGLETFEVFEGWIVEYAFDALFLGVCLVALAFVAGVLILNEPLENRTWMDKASVGFKMFKGMSAFAYIVARIGFLPILKVFLRALPCQRVDNMLVMAEKPSVECFTAQYWTYVVTAVVLASLLILVAYRLARTDYQLQRLEVDFWNPIRFSQDAIPRGDRPLSTPLTSKSLDYDQAVIVIKTIFMVVGLYFPRMWNGMLAASVFFVGGLCLTMSGVVFDQFAPEQKRSLDPNSIGTAIDLTVTYTYALTFAAAVLEARCSHDCGDLVLRWACFATPLVLVLSYGVRPVLVVLFARVRAGALGDGHGSYLALSDK
eukprot:TRINITY_DN15231_c0_g1_i1.p1 TRINITY_DN15231_c0_g1~~TRINITY_DN15231_c0_g1_i1.p1  ORF type:complete len:857 (+),score=92.96 TRINITY_DN15231_c0_g1_i1:202-2571(+)